MEDDLITVGIVLGVRGLKGQLRVESLSDIPGRFVKGQPLSLNGTEKIIRNAINGPKGLILELEGIDSRECAEKYRGYSLKISPEKSENLIPSGSYFHHQIIEKHLDSMLLYFIRLEQLMILILEQLMILFLFHHHHQMKIQIPIF